MNPLCELLVGGLLWAAIIAGLIYVVRDCMKERHQEPSFPHCEEEDKQHSCGLGCVEILTRKCQEP